MRRKRFWALLAAAALVVALLPLVLAPAATAKSAEAEDVRFATFNASLNRNFDGQLMVDLSAPGNPQADAVAEIIQRVNPDVLLINEFDFDSGGVALAGFITNYLEVPHGDAAAITDYDFTFIAPSNTGIHPGADPGIDFDNNGVVDPVPAPFNFTYANDAYGFGWFPGQFGMAVLSRYPIDGDNIRTFQNFLWEDMPGALLPDNPGTPAPADWYSQDELDIFRLSSKSHWDVPILIDGRTVHFLVSHPTPPVFDDPAPFPPGSVDYNGRRNFDEIRFWADYIHPGRSGYIYDDNGVYGGLAGDDRFVIAGDQNSDPLDGDSIPGSIQQLLDHPKVNTKMTPTSPGGPEQAVLQGGANDTHLSGPAFDTADFSDSAPGNLRADYVLPRKNMKIMGSGVFWPLSSDPLFPLVGTFPFPSSDHRLVWIDVRVG